MSNDDPDGLAPDAPARADELRHVEALEVELLDPAVRANARRLAERLHPDFVEHGASSRIWTRQEVIDELPLEDHTTPATTAAGLVVQHLADNVILVTYRTTSSLKQAIRSSIWLRSTDDTWTMRFHQGTVVPYAGSSAPAPIPDSR